MQLVYTPHARQRMKQRGITDDDVRRCLANYNQSVTRRDGRTEYQATISGRNLKVVVEIAGNPNNRTVVITTMWRDDDR